MVVGFRRTISFPAPKAATAAKGEAYRVRSASLPCRFHPLVVQLDEDVATMRELVGRLLDNFLRLADAHGSFRAALVALSALQAEATAAVFSGVSSLSIAAATARVEVAATPCWMPSPARFTTPSATPRHHIITTKPSSLRIWWVADLMRWMSRAKRRSASKQHADSDASSSSTSSAATARPQPNVAVDPDERERKAAFERLDNLGRCIADVESIGEKVFRALVNTRVSLLNILSTSF